MSYQAVVNPEQEVLNRVQEELEKHRGGEGPFTCTIEVRGNPLTRAYDVKVNRSVEAVYRVETEEDFLGCEE